MKTTKILTILPLGLLALTLTTQQLYANDSQNPNKSLGNLPPKIQQFLATPNAVIIAQDAVQNPGIIALPPLAAYGASQVIQNATMGSRAGSSLLTSLARQVDGYKWWILGGTAAVSVYVLITRKNKALDEEKNHIVDVDEAVTEFQNALAKFPTNPNQVTAADIDHLLGVLAYSNSVADPYLIPHTRQLANTHYELAEKTIAQLEQLRDTGLEETSGTKASLTRQLAHSKLAQTLFGRKLGKELGKKTTDL
jgi:hypothetical protein